MNVCTVSKVEADDLVGRKRPNLNPGFTLYVYTICDEKIQQIVGIYLLCLEDCSKGGITSRLGSVWTGG